MFNQYPYINLNDLNLDYILKAIKEMRNDVTNFVSINAIKYADPIQWNITSQYEKNTIVIDPQTGTAYISVAPVPAGVALTRPEYWTVVFDLGAFVTRAAKNFTLNYEEDTTTTATFSTTAGEWLIWGDTLYVAKVNITAGDTYVVDGNIERITIEEVKNNLITIIDGYYDTITGIIGALADLTTTDKDSIVDAINSIITERGALANLTTTDTDSIVNAINSIITERGALSDLTTTDKDSIVDAINEIASSLSGLYDTADIRNYGGVADGVTDNTQAFNDCMAANNVVYFPNYNGNEYYIANALTISDGQSVVGDMGTTITSDVTGVLFTINGSGVLFNNLIIKSTVANSIQNSAFCLSGSVQRIFLTRIYTYNFYYLIHDGLAVTTPKNTNLYMYVVTARTHRGGLDIRNNSAFLLLDHVTIDHVGASASPTIASFAVANNAGAHFVQCEAEGGGSTGSNSGHCGFRIVNCQALWFDECMADTVDSVGFSFANGTWLYLNKCVASLCFGHGFEFTGTDTHDVIMNSCIARGRSDLTPNAAAHGIYSFAYNMTVGDCDIQYNTQYGVVFAAARQVLHDSIIGNNDQGFYSNAGYGLVHDNMFYNNTNGVTSGSFKFHDNNLNGTYEHGN